MHRMVRNIGMNGMFMEHDFPPHENVDVEGNVITRTKQSHPYSFDDCVRWIKPKYHGLTKPFAIKVEAPAQFHTAYCDRLGSWDREKFDTCFKEHLPIGSGGFRWGHPAEIQKFLAAYFGDPALELVKIVDCCNHSSGYEVFRFDFIYTPQERN